MRDIELSLVKLNSKNLVTFLAVILFKSSKENLSYKSFINYSKCKCITPAARFDTAKGPICFITEGKNCNYYSGAVFRVSHACVVIVLLVHVHLSISIGTTKSTSLTTFTLSTSAPFSIL